MQKKSIVRFLIQLLIFIILLELCLRIIFYQQFGRDKLAILQTAKDINRMMLPSELDRIYHDYLLARPDSSNEVNKMIAKESFASNYFEYTPWTEYKNIDFAGRYINTKGSIRTTMPDVFINADTAAVKTIWFLGGSTMYGLNVTDRETIASAFVNSYKEQFPKGVSVKVVNYGIPAYYSYNELMLLSHLFYSSYKPDVVVTFDGLNNFLMATAATKRLPYFYYKLRLAGKNKLNLKELENINDSTGLLFKIPGTISEGALVDSLVKNYLSDINNMKGLATKSGCKAFFFVQPNPFYDYPHKKNDPVCDGQEFPIVAKGYEELKKRENVSDNFFFLGNMLHDEKGYPFIDRFHYSPAMCKKIAEKIVTIVGKDINGNK